MLTVRGGKASLEERGLSESDFDDPLDSRCAEPKFAAAPAAATAATNAKGSAAAAAAAAAVSKGEGGAAAPAAVMRPESDEERKKRVNAPRRVPKIESMLQKLEEDSAAIDAQMMANGRDAPKLRELQTKKDEIKAKTDKLLAEMEDLMQYLS